MLIQFKDSILILVDYQERLVPVIENGQCALEKSRLLLKTALRLSVPVLITEQYPKGLGPTTRKILDLAPQVSPIEKISFSAMQEGAFARALKDSGRRQVVIAGMETHVCLLQTAMDIHVSGYDLFLVRDACGSRRGEDKETAIARLAGQGVTVCTAEMVFFEWLHHAATPQFRDLLPLVK